LVVETPGADFIVRRADPLNCEVWSKAGAPL
jgi:hypothetical protein